jgi:RNA polymerase sigma factor (TIGR02999 family)
MSDVIDVTQLLEKMQGGDRETLDRLLPAVYGELREVASRELRRERADHTLGATAMVHEAYLKLVKLDRVDWEGRAHFFGAAAVAMRRGGPCPDRGRGRCRHRAAR